MSELPAGTAVTMIDVPWIEEYNGLEGVVIGSFGEYRSDTHLVEFIDPDRGGKNTVHAVVEPVLPKGNPVKYMIDFNRMLLIKEGFFDSVTAALLWIENNVTEEMWSSQSESWQKAWGSLESFKSLYTIVPIYQNGDERLETYKYGRYSGGMR